MTLKATMSPRTSLLFCSLGVLLFLCGPSRIKAQTAPVAPTASVALTSQTDQSRYEIADQLVIRYILGMYPTIRSMYRLTNGT